VEQSYEIKSGTQSGTWNKCNLTLKVLPTLKKSNEIILQTKSSFTYFNENWSPGVILHGHSRGG
jgi:hypothetical protein